jgi:hypothetical protein
MLIIVCDGVSEGNFSNPEVVKLISESIEADGDPSVASRKVILHAEKMGSKDNITCMVVLFDGKQEADGLDTKVFTPCPITDASASSPMLKCQEAMAKRAGITLGRAFEMRYDIITEELFKDDLPSDCREELMQELEFFGSKGPEGDKGSDERVAWFEKLATTKQTSTGRDDSMPDERLHQMMMQQMYAGQMPAQQEEKDGRWVLVSDKEALKIAMMNMLT